MDHTRPPGSPPIQPKPLTPDHSLTLKNESQNLKAKSPQISRNIDAQSQSSPSRHLSFFAEDEQDDQQPRVSVASRSSDRLPPPDSSKHFSLIVKEDRDDHQAPSGVSNAHSQPGPSNCLFIVAEEDRDNKNDKRRSPLAFIAEEDSDDQKGRHESTEPQTQPDQFKSLSHIAEGVRVRILERLLRLSITTKDDQDNRQDLAECSDHETRSLQYKPLSAIAEEVRARILERLSHLSIIAQEDQANQQGRPESSNPEPQPGRNKEHTQNPSSPHSDPLPPSIDPDFIGPELQYGLPEDRHPDPSMSTQIYTIRAEVYHLFNAFQSQTRTALGRLLISRRHSFTAIDLLNYICQNALGRDFAPAENYAVMYGVKKGDRV